MAGVSQKNIKSRIRSLKSTLQITKAMETVANSKLRKAQAQLHAARPYCQILQKTLKTILSHNRDLASGYLKIPEGTRAAYVVIAGDRGLAGGYYHNLFKLLIQELEGKEAVVVPVGKKAVEFSHGKTLPVLQESMVAERITAEDCFALGQLLADRFLAGQTDAVYVVYTRFASVLRQEPKVLRLLPLVREESTGEKTGGSDILYEPDSEEVFGRIVPEYLGGVLYGALCESRTSEQAARRTAMDTASKNADEMIGDLRLVYNRVRQAAITQEITQIVAGN